MDNGIYQEIICATKVILPLKVTRGDNMAVSIQYDNDNSYNGGTGKGQVLTSYRSVPRFSGGRSVMTIVVNQSISVFENVTIENTNCRYRGLVSALY